MKAELTKDGYVKITAETVTEAWALNITCPPGAEVCDKCEHVPLKVIIDGSILSSDQYDTVNPK